MESIQNNFTTFWDVASPVEAAGAFVKLYGPDAAGAARECAQTATADGRDEDYRFWLAVMTALGTGQWMNLKSHRPN